MAIPAPDILSALPLAAGGTEAGTKNAAPSPLVVRLIAANGRVTQQKRGADAQGGQSSSSQIVSWKPLTRELRRIAASRPDILIVGCATPLHVKRRGKAMIRGAWQS